VNANDAQMTELLTANTGSTVENQTPNAPAPGQPKFEVVLEAVAGSAIGGSGAPYTLTVTAMDLTDVKAAPALNPTIANPQHFDVPAGWKPNGLDFEYSKSFSITVPAGGKYTDHVLQYVASLVTPNGQIVSIIESEPFVLI
jgi:hypothetical protein